MNLLAIETSGEYASLAVLDRAGQLTESARHSPEGHSSLLFGEIQSLLRRAGVRMEDLDCFAAAAGPGSFTGVRVALSAAKGLAAVMGKPMVAVSNLQALAWFGEAPLRAVLLDARRGGIYAAVFNERLEPVQAEIVTTLEPWLASLPAGELEIVVAAPELLAGRALSHPVRVVPPELLARGVAWIARAQALAGRAVDPALTDANYVRRADAEMKWVDRP